MNVLTLVLIFLIDFCSMIYKKKKKNRFIWLFNKGINICVWVLLRFF